MAVLAILQPDARAAARLAGALTGAHRVVVRRSWETLERALGKGDIEGCLVDADHPDPDVAARQIAEIRDRYPGLAIIAYLEPAPSHGYFDLGGLGVDGVVTSATPGTRLRADVDHAFSTSRGDRIARALEHRIPSPGPEAVAWAVAHASHETNVEKLAAALGHTPRGLRDALHEIGMPAPARVLLWGRLLLAGARLGSDGRTVEEVAFSLGYSASTALARAMKQHTGYTPGQVSERGGMDVVRHALFPPAGGAAPVQQAVAKLAALALLFLISG